MKASTAYRTQVITEALQREARSLSEMIAVRAQELDDALAKGPAASLSEHMAHMSAALHPMLAKLDEIRAMLTEKK